MKYEDLTENQKYWPKKFLNLMSGKFKSIFAEAHKEKTNEELILEVYEETHDLYSKELEYGYNELQNQQYLPNFSSLKRLCIEAGVWQNPEIAWCDAVEFDRGKKILITTVTKAALDKAISIYGINYFSRGKEIFILTYKEEIKIQRQRGVEPQFYRRQKEKIENNNEVKPCSREEAQIYLENLRKKLHCKR